ncbi:hypothetical protein CROQUDRAFT_650228 [Cronartium quercuum f. sp. fusiforme G11]|uniref:Uncharacterized protein n=1 Tax=Cronartium quercuum f. sp. fusiforme G11 TaxID=708437 RepID=A0A9P6TH59_9BASI|nr:hypothetical protein CROQUDRAFT_650228 [Cronartium quercuum f. sp. fusiforme G11]
MNTTFQSFATHPCKKRDHPLGPPTAFSEEPNENFASLPTRGTEQMMSDGPEPESKRSRLDDPQPVLQFHVREASVPDHQQPVAPVKKSYKNRNLNISIPPVGPAPPSALCPGLGLSPTSDGDPVTPLYQIVHTPTTAPGAPGPGDPAEIRRLEKSWANSMGNDEQISPAFPNFRHGSETNESGLMLEPSAHASGHETSAALREMFALTASAKTPTFAPASFSLTFGNENTKGYQSGTGTNSG